MSDADRYTKIVYWSDEDQCFIGCCPKLVLGGCHGDDPKAVFAQLCEIVSEAVERYAKEGRDLPPPDANYEWPMQKQSVTTS